MTSEADTAQDRNHLLALRTDRDFLHHLMWYVEYGTLYSRRAVTTGYQERILNADAFSTAALGTGTDSMGKVTGEQRKQML